MITDEYSNTVVATIIPLYTTKKVIKNKTNNPVQDVMIKYRFLKPESISERKLKQLRFESDSWKRLLGFIQDENVHLKNRVADILKNDFNKDKLEDVEYFQSRFIKKDEMIRLLQNEVTELDDLLLNQPNGNIEIIKDISRKQKRLGSNIKKSEKQFNKLKAEFNRFLTQNI